MTRRLERIRQNKRTVYVFLALAVFLALQMAMVSRLYFMSDDFAYLLFAKTQQNVWQSFVTPGPGGWTTPLPNFFFSTLYRLFGAEPEGYYWFNAILHFVNVVIVYHLIKLVSPKEGVALLGACIFGLHFAHYSDYGPLVWISARVHPVVAAFYLSSLTLFIHFWKNRRGWSLVVSLGFFFLALLSKEAAISLPLLVFCAALILSPRPVRLGPVFLATLPYGLVGIGYLAYELWFQIQGDYFSYGLYGFGPHVITNLRYFSNLFMPNPTSEPVHNFIQRTLTGSVPVVLSWIADGLAVAFLGFCTWLWVRRPTLRFWIALMFIAYLPFIAFVPGYAGPNRYFYLPLVGFAVILAELGVELALKARQVRWARWAAPAIVVGLFVYNLIPGFFWTRQMAANSSVRVQAIGTVASAIEADPSLFDKGVCVVGFHTKYQDLIPALSYFFGIDATFTGASDPACDCTGPRSACLTFADNQVAVQVGMDQAGK